MKVFKVTEVAKMFNVHFNTIKTWKSKGLIPSATIGRDRLYTVEDIKSYASKVGRVIEDYEFMSRDELLEEVKRLNNKF